MYLLVFAFVADFPSDAPEFYQHMICAAYLTKNLLMKSSTERFRKYVKEEGRSYADYQRM